MHNIPKVARPAMEEFTPAFTRPTLARFTFLLFAAILTTGQRTVINVLRTWGHAVPGHPVSYHRVFSHRRWSSWRLSRGLAAWILRHWVPLGQVSLVGDDTVDEHRGKKVYGKACHRDAVRSTHSYTAYRWGHKWVVLAILVKFPFACRPWALPLLVALYRSPKWNKKHKRRHKTPAELMRQLLAVLLHWFPQRKFVFAGDGGFGTQALARFAHRHRRRLLAAGRSKPHFRKCVRIWAWRRPAVARRRRCCVSRHACLGCTRWWPRCMPNCLPLGAATSPWHGQAKAMPPSPTPLGPFDAGCGWNGLL